MTPIATDEDLLHRALDANPADHGARLALSDLYEERGEAAAAEALRWAAAKGRYPKPESNQPNLPWSWAAWTAVRDFSELPDALLDAMKLTGCQSELAFRLPLFGFPDRRAAEAALAAAWAHLSPAGRAECWAWDPPPAP